VIALGEHVVSIRHTHEYGVVVGKGLG